MKRNIGNGEILTRITLGLGISSLAFLGPQNPWFLLGLVLVVTGLARWCPIYAFFGHNTCKSETQPLTPKPR